jgi:hypothetical protein
MSTVVITDIQMRPFASNTITGVYLVKAQVEVDGVSREIVFTTDVKTGAVHVWDKAVMSGPRQVVWPERFGPRLGRQWATAYAERTLSRV